MHPARYINALPPSCRLFTAAVRLGRAAAGRVDRVDSCPARTQKELFLIDGNSLVYRAFFALPESIATSKGQPTNAIFGFASMLVKIISEYGVKPTLVVWDAGMSGRKEVYEEYKGAARLEARPARRAVAVHAAARGRVRLRERARGGLRGRRRDRDGRASGAREGLRGHGRDRRPRPVPADRAGRAGDGHEPRHHGDEGLRPRRRDRPLRHRARADPRLRRAEGRHLGQHPRRSRDRREDRVAAAPGARLARGRAREHRQDLRRQAQGEPHEPRRGRAHLEDARHRDPRHGRRRHRPGPHRRARARPLAAARDLPRVRAARAARAARGGARRGRGGGAGRARRGGHPHQGARGAAGGDRLA